MKRTVSVLVLKPVGKQLVRYNYTKRGCHNKVGKSRKSNEEIRTEEVRDDQLEDAEGAFDGFPVELQLEEHVLDMVFSV